MLTARAGELSMRGDELVLSETADRGQGHAWEGYRGYPAPGFREGPGSCSGHDLIVFFCYYIHYIHVLLVKTNPMILKPS